MSLVNQKTVIDYIKENGINTCAKLLYDSHRTDQSSIKSKIKSIKKLYREGTKKTI